MNRLVGVVLTFAATAAVTAGVAGFQPPDGGGKKGQKGQKGGKGGQKGFQLGWVLPPHIRQELDLTADQEKKVDALEKDVKAKLEKILTPDQIKRVAEAGPPMGKDGGPGGKEGGPGGKEGGKGGPPPEKGERPGGDDE